MSKRKGSKLPLGVLPTSIHSEVRGTPLPTVNSPRTINHYRFSFSNFDREHELFNLGDDKGDRIVSSTWFLAFLDCLKEVSNTRIVDLKSGKFDLHPVDWEHFNTSPLHGVILNNMSLCNFVSINPRAE